VAGPFSQGLAGRTFCYTYSSGIGYRVSFDTEKVYFIPKPCDPGQKSIILPYLAKELRDGLYVAHWMVPGLQGHVSVILDLVKKQAVGAGLMPGKIELFDQATFDEMLENGEGALYKE
jgi:MoaF N-terminal domain